MLPRYMENIIPVHKKSDKRLVKNYRPILSYPSLTKDWQKKNNLQ